MNISATFQGQTVNIIDIDVNGSAIYVTYLDGAGTIKKSLLYGTDETISIATCATIIS